MASVLWFVRCHKVVVLVRLYIDFIPQCGGGAVQLQTTATLGVMHRQGVIALAPGIQSPYADPLGGVRQRERERNDFHSARASSPVRADGGACAVPGHAGIVG